MKFFSNIRFAFRLLAKNPGSTLLAIVVMATGTGVAITMFAFINGVLWSPLELNEKREIYHIKWTEADKLRNRKEIHPLDVDVFEMESQSFEKLTAFRWGKHSFYNHLGNSLAERLDLAIVRPDFFEFIGEEPMLGRTFTEEDAASGEMDKVIISHAVWRRHFEAKEDAIGATAMLNGRPRTIIGVMRPGFTFPEVQQIWLANNQPEAIEKGRESWHRLNLLGVLADGATVAQAKTEFNTIAKRLAQEYPKTNENLQSVDIIPYVSWYAQTSNGDQFNTICYALLFCGLLVLGVACANVFNLIMARTATRTSELSIRKAVGASKIHIIMQVVLDGLILTTIGALGGTLLAGWGLKLIWFKFSQQEYVPYWWHIEMDATVIAFVVLLVLGSAFASSLVPGLRASHTSVANNLKDDARTSSGLFLGSLSKFILGFQITATAVLAFISITMLLIWSHLKSRDLSYDSDAIITESVDLSPFVWGDRKGKLNEFIDTFNDRMMALPGVEAVAWSTKTGGGASKGQWHERTNAFEVDGVVYEPGDQRPLASQILISDQFEKVFGLEPVLGRSMTEMDTDKTQQVCVVNQTFVDYYWKGENPIGKRIRMPGVNWFGTGYRTVVGVLPNIMPKPHPGENLSDGVYQKIYFPISQASRPHLNILVRAEGDPTRLIEPMRRTLRDLAPDIAFNGDPMTLTGFIDREMASKDLVFAMFGIFGVASLILGIVGLYAVVNFTTKQRSREFGIRMALGANTTVILQTAMKRGLFLLCIAGTLGVGIGHFASTVLKSSIELNTLPIGYTYPLVFATLVLGLGTALILPAIRASRTPPNKSLRIE
ncbi:ABC transporter permease [Pelagicoccus mobilis]|uniref:ABC transporter permease n=1 Tax=Pelagicoccus mobilis TaxID=415221 RepID=A0A934RVG4_9BACT|nr:ABC transporter permease [Pelagicoccus mobilis]MBK1877562.1 ABC transporter permease [Pelagicoccus mobilis]